MPSLLKIRQAYSCHLTRTLREKSETPPTIITLTLPTPEGGGISLERATATLLIQRGRWHTFTSSATMPRTCLRYAIEHLDAEQRAHYMGLKKKQGGG